MKITHKNHKKITKALIKFGEKFGKLNFKKEKYFTPNLKADKLIWNNSFAYLFGVILDQNIKAEKAWEIPYLLKQRLGHLNVHKIANMKDEDLVAIFNQKPKLHRFPKIMALRIKKACQLLVKRYNGKTENIWKDNPKSSELVKRFKEFEGIGQKKASMATNILVRDFGIKVKDKRGIDISYDIHIRRVFLRTGLVEKDNMNSMIEIARKLNPEYPGLLDNPCWIIGRKYCHFKNPKCNQCPISKVCPKIIKIN
jgi:uncharacterized HhH-GPD family protein